MDNEKEEIMAAPVMEPRPLFKLTQENHPENAPEAPKDPTVSLWSIIAISALSGVVGMTFGTAALSSAMAADGPGEVVSLLPLVVTGVCILSGWLGAFFWMVREEASKRHGS